MIWVLIIVAIVVISLMLAFRSMRTYKEIPTTKFAYGLFLIQNERLIYENGVLNKLYEFCAESNAIISLERLFNGSEKALVLYAPQNVGQFIPELELLEIEDYLAKAPKSPHQKILPNDTVVWSIKPKNDPDLVIKAEFMKEFAIDPSQNFFWQIVMAAAKKTFHFQVNIRTMIVDTDVQNRVNLAKFVTQYVKDLSSLEKNNNSETIGALYDEFQKRTITPSEAEGFVLSTQTIKQLI